MKESEALRLSDNEMRILRKIRESVISVVSDATVFFFGSRARGNPQQHSDWDILVLIEKVTPEAKEKIYGVLYDIELEEDIIIGPLILARDEWENKRFRNHPIHEEIDKEGILV
jgi:uncharacterized protein